MLLFVLFVFVLFVFLFVVAVFVVLLVLCVCVCVFSEATVSDASQSIRERVCMAVEHAWTKPGRHRITQRGSSFLEARLGAHHDPAVVALSVETTPPLRGSPR